MLTLIAESKAMCDSLSDIAAETLALHTPVFELQASEIIGRLRELDDSVFSADFKLGPVNIRRLQNAIYDFSNKQSGMTAIEAFTGVVFRALDVSTLSRQQLDENVIIVSSLYGLLHPSDIIKPYRLDFMMKASPLADASTLASYWKPLVTERLAEIINGGNHTEILNLLPADAAKCIDWKRIEKKVKVWNAGFKHYTDSGTLSTPSSEHLKRLRGQLLRHIISASIDSIAQLRLKPHPEMLLYPDPAPEKLLFITA